jgi:hypothetical protein
VGRHQHGLLALEGGHDGAVPEREAALDGVLEALRKRQLLLGNVRILVVVAGPIPEANRTRRSHRDVPVSPASKQTVPVWAAQEQVVHSVSAKGITHREVPLVPRTGSLYRWEVAESRRIGAIP